MKRHAFLLGRMVVFALLVVSLMAFLTGCKGDTGAQGPAGPSGTDLTPTAKTETCVLCHQSGSTVADPAAIHTGMNPPATYTATINQVTTAVVGTGVTFTVHFTVLDANNNYISALTTTSSSDGGTRLSYLRLAYAKLEPGAAAGDATKWTSYNQAERNRTRLTDNLDGTYTYVTGAQDTTVIGYNANATTRMGLQVSGAVVPRPMNVSYDFVPVGGALPTRRDIVTTAACQECHGNRTNLAHGSRYDSKYCAVCHTLETLRNGQTVEFQNLVHKIHTSQTTSALDASGVTYPQDITNCKKCHKGLDGDNWKTVPTMNACGASCHNIVFTVGTGTLHSDGAQTDNSQCATCHDPANIETKHLTDNATTNNPSVPAGATNFAYVISGVTVTNNQPVVTFRILSGPSITTISTPVTLTCNTSSSTSANRLLTGFSGSPSFLVAYALPQNGVAAPADYNNLGKSAAQPASVSIANVCNGSQGSMTGPDGSGYYTATLTGSNNSAVFPAGAKLRAGALQGYFTQVSPAVARHTVSAYKAVTGDIARRSIVDNAKCFNCHEWFEGHGGNRVYTTEVCVMCHVPNLSTSGRGADPANLSSADAAALAADGYDTADPSTWPEATNNFKDLIHGIHAAGARTTDYRFVRDRGTSGVYYYNWKHVEFPGILSNCETCHKAGTAGGYDIDLPAGVLPTTNITTDGNASTSVAQDRASVPNAADVITSPAAATCIACHDGGLPVDHMKLNGGSIDVQRSTGQ